MVVFVVFLVASVVVFLVASVVVFFIAFIVLQGSSITSYERANLQPFNKLEQFGNPNTHIFIYIDRYTYLNVGFEIERR